MQLSNTLAWTSINPWYNIFDKIAQATPKKMSYEQPWYQASVNTTKPTDSWFYKAVAPYEQTAENVTWAMQDTSKMYEQKAQDISAWWQQTGKSLQNKNYLAKDEVFSYIDRLWLSPDKQKEFVAWLINKGYTIEGINEGSQPTGTTWQVLWQWAKLLGWIGSMFASAPWQVTWGATNLGQWVWKIASAQSWQDLAEWATQATLWWVQAWFWVATWAMPIASTVLWAIWWTDTGGKVLWALSQGGQYIGQKGSELLWANQQTQQYSGELWANLAPLITLKWLSVWGKKIAPYIKPTIDAGVAKTWEMINKVLPTKQGIKNVSNSAAEQILSSQWKLDKKTRDVMQQNIGENGAKFALERDIVGKDIESTADNAWAYKLEKMQEKMDAVKNFWTTETPDVARNVANVLKNDITDGVEKSYWKDADAMKILQENHPELASVLKLTDEVINSNSIDYLKLEQLKELHDYLNPEGIQYDISGKPISETKNILSAWKRGKLQQILEEAGNKNGVDIKGINKDIQWAYQLERWLNNSVSRIQNLNIIGLWDTQIAMISSILGGTPWALWALLVKKWLQSEWFRAWVAKKLFTKTPKDVNSNILNPSGAVTPPITRMGRIMNNSNTPTPKVEPSLIPWATKTTLEVLSNPKGNQSKTLAGKQWVMVEWEKKLLPARTKEWVLSSKTKENTPIAKKSGVEPKKMVDWEKVLREMSLTDLKNNAKGDKSWYWQKEIDRRKTVTPKSNAKIERPKK